MSANPQQQDTLNPIIKRRNLVRRNSSHRNSRYLHPLALNLCFPNLKSLHENATSTLGNGPTSPTSNDLSTPTSPSSPSSANHNFRVAMNNNQHANDTPHPIVMKQFFWSKLPMDKIENTVWNEIVKSPIQLLHDTSSFETSSASSSDNSSDEDESAEQAPIQLDTVELERLFKKGQKEATATATSSSGSKAATIEVRKQNLITLLEFNRANNIAIMLAKIKLPYPDIRDAIWNIDDNSLSTDNLMAIRQYIPTKEEIEIVKEYQGDVDMLGNAERYYRSIMYIPRLADRVSCMIFRRRFKDELEEILPELDIIQMAITELKSSTKFKHVLKTVLAIGNYLNGQTIRGNARGFHLDALLKMRDTRAEGEGVSNVPTLLHYLVYFLSKSDDDVVNFRQEISHLQAAAKLSAPTLFATVNSLNGNLNQIKEELNMNRRRKTSELQIDRFAEAMDEFVLEAEPVVNDLKAMTRDIEEKLKDLIVYYGEDPNTIKSEEFFDIISTFSNSFEKAQIEIHEARERALKRQRQQEMQLKKRQQQQQEQQQQQQQITSSSIAAFSTSSPVMESFTRPTEEGFEQVLRELKAGLRTNEEAWQNTISRRNKMRATLASATIAE
ncbi:hypothetical protein G6F42_017606 [Rhizopus arrhizus]|nr:hypothetical protein G6F42_017606 [Rhizopus arrhizus]